MSILFGLSTEVLCWSVVLVVCAILAQCVTNVFVSFSSVFMVCGSMDKCDFIFLILTSDGTKVRDFFGGEGTERSENEIICYSNSINPCLKSILNL